MPKKVLIALPVGMLEQIDYVAQAEHRTRSDLIRESLRQYLNNFRRANGGGQFTITTLEAPTPPPVAVS